VVGGQVRSAIVNTADQGVILRSNLSGVETDVNIVGAGRDDLNSATHARSGQPELRFGSVRLRPDADGDDLAVDAERPGGDRRDR
jgi:hypothetical protein